MKKCFFSVHTTSILYGVLADSQVAVRFGPCELVKSQRHYTQKSRKLLSEKWWNLFGLGFTIV
jgi:hypothetical protein